MNIWGRKIDYPQVLWGQEDYVARMREYMRVLCPEAKPQLLVHPLAQDKPDGTAFDLDAFGDELKAIPRDVTVGAIFSAKFVAQAEEKLRQLGFQKIVCYSPALDNAWKTKYFQAIYRQAGREFTMLWDLAPQHEPRDYQVHVYMARCHVDKKLAHYPAQLPAAIIPIQVGAALCEKRICAVTDNTGENISVCNPRYSEMTAFYWMWQNDRKADYLGLCHYRRLWVDLDGIVEKLRTTDVDAVLPLPTLAEHSVYEDYLLKHIPQVWPVLRDVMQERTPEYYEAAKRIFRERTFYASNMCILRRNVLDDLCNWMFPIVMEVERRVGDLPDRYYNRYAGFITERLITLYFLYNKQHWRIAHAEKIFIS